MINRIPDYGDVPPAPVMGPGGPVEPAPSAMQMASVGCLLVFFLLMVVAVIGQVVINVTEIIVGGG